MAPNRKTGSKPLPVIGQRQLGVVVLDAYGRPFVRTYDDLASLFAGDKVSGPGSATDNGIPRYDGITGKLLQDTSGPTMPDDGRIANVTDPTSAQDAATKAYVDAQVVAGGGSSSGGHLHGLQRVLGDGSTTAFDLLDFAEYLLFASDNGLIVDPTLYALSADRSQITFTTAPTAGHVLTVSYVIASV